MLPVVQTQTGERAGWGVPASLALHVLFLLAAIFAAPVSPFVSLSEDKPVEVEIVPASQPAPAKIPAPPVLAAPPAPTAVTPPVAPPVEEPGMVHPSKMLSAAALAKPRARKARAELATFAESERVLQLCNLEAMEQIEAWSRDFKPDNLVAFARANEKAAGDTIKAPGAAFHSRDRWYDLSFDCELSPARDKVVAFAFKVGEAVPRKEWEDLGLPTGDAED